MPFFHSPLFYYAVLPVAIVVWVLFLQWVVAHWSGWSKLAQFHRADEKPEGTLYRWRSIQFLSFGGYNNCINVTITTDGVYVRPIWLGRFAHPPLMLPWKRMGTMQRERGTFGTRYFLPIHASGHEWKLYLPKEAQEKTERQMTAQGK